MSKDIRRETAAGVARLLEWAATVPLSAIDDRVLDRAALVLSDDLAAMIAASGEAQVAAAQRAFATTSAGHEFDRACSRHAEARPLLGCCRQWHGCGLG